jgi:5-formyltetrahydrofolate cyclo-ligase
MHGTTAKERLRRTLLDMRRSLAFEEVYAASAKAQQRLLSSGPFRSASRLSLYASSRNEVLTDDVFRKAAEDGKEVYYPRVVRGSSAHIEFFKVGRLDDLSPGSYDIKEPVTAPGGVSAASFDLVVVPGVAFDLAGARLGYGKGYFDRALKGVGCQIVALAYDFQVLEGPIPVEPHDVRVSAIVTETRFIEI